MFAERSCILAKLVSDLKGMKDLLKLGNEMCSCTKLRANEWTRKRNNLEMQQLVETGTYDCLTDAIQGSYRPIDETVNAKTELVNFDDFFLEDLPTTVCSGNPPECQALVIE